ncbi:hypothetical protein [Alistipes sp.]|uniref:hypothetical protein n=1 Tax=Alistipes sp. TaxID=1872444 RepID=UPI0023F3D1D9|nr:hypothetical protein [Alistipes sp.]
MNEKEADAIRKSMYESLLMDENDKIVHWDFDPMCRELRAYVDIACGCDEQTYGIRTPQFEYRYCTGKIKMPFAKSDYLANDDIMIGAGCREILVCAGLYLRLCRNLV